jgi:hypothetical protein
LKGLDEIIINCREFMEKISEKYKVEKDEVYGFDFAVYPKTENKEHSHSLALIKTIEGA